MFCSNCGNKLTAGEKFCSVCGAKVETGTEQPVRRDKKEGSFGRYEATRNTSAHSFDAGAISNEVEVRKPLRNTDEDVSFDWSSVVDESHKKTTPDIRSPWDSKGLEEKERDETARAVNSRTERSVEDRVFNDAKNSKPDRGRTMSFIDILKQEREEKERKANEEANKAMAPRTDQDDFSAFDKTDDFGYSETVLPKNDREYTRGYTDLKRDVVAGLGEEKNEDAERRVPADFDSQMAYIRARKDAKAVDTPEPPRSFINDDNKTFDEDKAFDKAFKDDTYSGRASHAAAAAEKATAKSGKGDLENELAEILGIGKGMKDKDHSDRFAHEPEVPEPEVPEDDVDLFDEGNSDSSENDYLDYSPRVGRAARAASMEDNEFMDDADKYDEYDEYDSQELEVDTAKEKASVTSEIEELQQRLAELLGQKEEEPERIPAREAAAAEDLTEDDENVSDRYLRDGDAFFNADLADNEDNEEDFTYEDEAETYASEGSAAEEEPVAADDYAFDEEEEAEDFSFDDVTKAVEEPERFEENTDQETPVTPVTEDTAVDAQDESDELDLESELSALGFDVDEPSVIMDKAPAEEDMLFTNETLETPEGMAEVFDGEEAENDAMSIDELENDLFGNEANSDDLEATRKIEKFYTLYRKNEEFQQLLDSEYDKLKSGEDFDLGEGELADLVDNNEIPAEGDEAQSEVAGGAAATQEVPKAAMAQAAQTQAVPEQQAVTEQVPVMQKPAPKADDVKTAPVADVSDEEREGKGGVLTVLAIIVAVLLVCLLAVILILSFAPDSGIASQLNQVIDNFSKLIASNDGDISFLL